MDPLLNVGSAINHDEPRKQTLVNDLG
jgi:hypothetical protein